MKSIDEKLRVQKEREIDLAKRESDLDERIKDFNRIRDSLRDRGAQTDWDFGSLARREFELELAQEALETRAREISDMILAPSE